MFGEPVAPIAQLVGKARQVEGVAQGLRAARAGGHGRKIEHGQPVFFALSGHPIPLPSHFHFTSLAQLLLTSNPATTERADGGRPCGVDAANPVENQDVCPVVLLPEHSS